MKPKRGIKYKINGLKIVLTPFAKYPFLRFACPNLKILSHKLALPLKIKAIKIDKTIKEIVEATILE